MRIAKINTIAYDPESKTLSFTGLNRFSRPRQGSIFIDDEVKFIEIIHQVLANSALSSVDFAAELKGTPEKKSKKSSSNKTAKTKQKEQPQSEATPE
ncbi:hypothetical protein DKP76_10405 [Falsochrobactrum shanghaiense]|uniref:Uncharacterized protein n=1 Tax=Falsochrobactrum shanghaiense TaxID=2201899 RepID=A0A316J850_9HYPH|nr:hypothetical protein [Falsochrobactrum shanghaiense]PWL18122.1 hypothetical protein DKP76_10405 [Falsochrobactrum shanghaiense]